MIFSRTSLSPGGQLLTVLAGLSVWYAGPHASTHLAAATGADFPTALLGLLSLVQLVIGAWVIGVVGLAQLSGSAAAVRAVTPRVLRGALFASTAGMLAIGPSHADRGAAPPRDHATASVTSHELAGLPYPDRPQSDRRRFERLTGAGGHSGHSVIVQPGDNLWVIARRSLPAEASDAVIARSCADWFEVNRHVIGPNPDLIIPHQRLISPAKEHR